MRPREFVCGILASSLLVSASGCYSIDYERRIEVEAPDFRESAFAGAIAIDQFASYFEVDSDSSDPLSFDERYDRGAILGALETRWNEGRRGEAAAPVRAALVLRVDHHLADVVGGTLQGLTGFLPAILGMPVTCASAEAWLVLQSADRELLVGRGAGSSCVGVYYPGDHVMKAAAAAVTDAASQLEFAGQAQLEELRAHVAERRKDSDPRDPPSAENPVWWPQTTWNFRLVWGEG